MEPTRTRETFFQTMVEESLDWLYWRGPEGELLYMSPSCARMTGYTDRDFLADPELLIRILHPDDRAQVEPHLRDDRGHGADALEFRITRKDGTTCWISHTCHPVKGEDGQVLGRRISHRDITVSKEAEAALEKVSAYNRTLLEASLDPLVTIGADGQIADVNFATELATGYDRDELIGTEFASYFAEPGLARAGYERVFHEGQVRDYPLSLRHRNGSVMPVLYNATVYRDRDGHVAGVFAAARDITERRRAEEAALQLERRLLQTRKAESLGRMAGAIAHNYNNLMAVILGNLELALDDLPAGSAVVPNLTAAAEAAHRAAEVSTLMLTYLGQSATALEPNDLVNTCRDAVPRLRATMPKTVQFDADLPSTALVVASNPHELAHVLSNLTTNAWEALADGQGYVRLRVAPVARAAIATTSRWFPSDWQPQHEQYACLEVADNGSGIEERQFEALFDPFFSTRFIGRGLGLPVVLGIVRAHGGVVTIDSVVGTGSVFRVYLPLVEAPAPAAQVRPSAAGDIVFGGTVLLVDDEPGVREVTAAKLTALGFTVLQAADGVDAVALFTERAADIRLVMSDLTMPRMDGWQTLSAIRALAPGMPVILSSGYDHAHVMAGTHAELPTVFLRKPYRSPALEQAVREALSAELRR